MANTRSMTRKLKKFSTSEKDGWSSFNPDLLFLIMMRVGVLDLIAFSGVCKSWRSVAVSNWNKFMVSKQPMRLSIFTLRQNKEFYLELEDYKRRKLKTGVPHCGRVFVGLTCGYLIFFARKTRDFWLVNPFTRKELHFRRYPFTVEPVSVSTRVKCNLVYSPSMFGWVFVVSFRYSDFPRVSFCLAGKPDSWRHVSSSSPICDLHFFKGKMYMLNASKELYELRLHPKPTLTLQKMANFSCLDRPCVEFVSSGENLYVTRVGTSVFEADFDGMKWVNSDTIDEYKVFFSDFRCGAAIKPDTWTHTWTQYERFNYYGIHNQHEEEGRLSTTWTWYFPQHCLMENKSDMENGALQNMLEE